MNLKNFLRLYLLILLPFYACSPAFAQIARQSDLFKLGKPSSGANKVLEFDAGLGSTNPKIRYNIGSSIFEFANDGTTFAAIPALTAGSVNTTQIADGAVTQAKLASRATGTSVAAGGVATSITSGSFNTTSTSFVNITGAGAANLTVTITTTGRPIWVGLISDGTTSVCDVASHIFTSTSSAVGGSIEFKRAATVMYFSDFSVTLTSAVASWQINLPCNMFSTIDFQAAGTYTYTVFAESAAANAQVNIQNLKLAAFEL